MQQPCAVVTGGARNIGQAIALRLQEDGFRVLVLDIVAPECDSLRADAVQIDLADTDGTKAVTERIAQEHSVNILVNNVGIVKPATLEDVQLEDFDRLMHLNVRTALICAKAFVPSMRREGWGRIVTNTSRVTRGKTRRTLYSGTKGALQAMSRTWALELAPDGITVNCVAPGPIATSAFWTNNDPDADYTRALMNDIPVGRMGQPEDVSNAVSFFCDRRAGFVTGQTLFVCGGVTVG